MFPATTRAGPTFVLLWSNRALKIGPGGVLSCVTHVKPLTAARSPRKAPPHLEPRLLRLKNAPFLVLLSVFGFGAKTYETPTQVTVRERVLCAGEAV